MRQRNTVVGCALWLLVCGCTADVKELVRVESEKEAIEILVTLASHDVYDATKKSVATQQTSHWAVEVPAGALPRAERVLHDNGLPRKQHGGYQEMLGQSGMFPNKTDERARLMRAQSEELTHTLEVYDRVLEARVHVVLPEKDRAWDSTPTPSTASVLIRYRPISKKKSNTSWDAHAYSIELPQESEMNGSGSAEESDGDSTGNAEHSNTDDEASAPRSRYVATGIQRLAGDADGNPDWPLSPQAVCWQVANGVEGLDPWDVAVSYAKARDLPDLPEAAAGGSAGGGGRRQAMKAKLMQFAAIGFGIATIVLALINFRLRRR